MKKSTRLLTCVLLLILFQFAWMPVYTLGVTIQDHPSGKSSTSNAVLPQPPILSISSNQLATNQVVVTYRDGELIVEADNVPLNEILLAISRQTGAQIAIPPRAGERMSRRIGPAPVEEIVDSLLSGLGINYIIEGWAGPNVPLRVTLLSEGGTANARRPAAFHIDTQPAAVDPQQRIEMLRQMNERQQSTRQAIIDRLKSR